MSAGASVKKAASGSATSSAGSPETAAEGRARVARELDQALIAGVVDETKIAPVLKPFLAIDNVLDQWVAAFVTTGGKQQDRKQGNDTSHGSLLRRRVDICLVSLFGILCSKRGEQSITRPP